MIRQAIASDDPVLFFEPKRRYWVKGEVDEDDRPDALSDGPGPGRRARARMSPWSPTARWSTTARDAALAAADEGISVEVIDLRSLSPLDFDTVEASVRKTGRLVDHPRGAAVRRPRRRDRRQHHRTLLRPSRGRAGAGDRLRRPVPAGEARGALPAGPGPDARRRRPRAAAAQLAHRTGGRHDRPSRNSRCRTSARG